AIVQGAEARLGQDARDDARGGRLPVRPADDDDPLWEPAGDRPQGLWGEPGHDVPGDDRAAAEAQAAAERAGRAAGEQRHGEPGIYPRDVQEASIRSIR